jgi:hypothetical protein
MDRERGTFKVNDGPRAGREIKGLIPDGPPEAAVLCQNFGPPSRPDVTSAYLLIISQTKHSFFPPKS